MIVVSENTELDVEAVEGLKNYSFVLQKGAKLRFTDRSTEGNNFLAELAEGCELYIENIKKNSKKAKSSFEILLKGEGSKLDFFGLSVLNDGDEVNVSTKVTHFAKNTSSTIILKAVLDGRCRSEQRAFTRVEKEALGSNVKQDIRSAILHEKALVRMFPNLEILGSSVKALHAAANFKIDPKELFYFGARGIDKEEAKKLLIEGFCNKKEL